MGVTYKCKFCETSLKEKNTLLLAWVLQHGGHAYGLACAPLCMKECSAQRHAYVDVHACIYYNYILQSL